MDHQDVPIWNAIEAGNFKHALKLVDKKLSKKHSNYHEALKVYIRSRSPAIAEKSAVIIHIEELVGRKPMLPDLEAIDLYDEALEAVLPKPGESWGRIIGELRWQCVKANPKNEDVSLKCFQACISKDDLDHARQIANSLEKNFPSNHAYVFWSIAIMFLYSECQIYPEKERRIYGGLALGQISKLATATIQAGESKQLPLRSIHTPQELLLLHRILQVHGKQEQRLSYLQDPYLGPESIIAKGEWRLWRFRFELMILHQQWEELFQTTSNLLKRARAKDESGQITESRYSDWVVWDSYMSAALEVPGYKHTDEVKAELEAHLDPASGIDKSWRRNASLASLQFTFKCSSPFGNSQTSEPIEDKLPEIFKYLWQYGKATTAYNDLKPFVESFGVEDRNRLLAMLVNNTVFERSEQAQVEKSQTLESLYPANQDLTTAGKITELVNTYKLIYLLTSSIAEQERSQSPIHSTGKKKFICKVCSKPVGLYCSSCLTELARSTMKSYGLAIKDDGGITKTLLPTDRHPADDLCVISAMCLAKLSIVNFSQVGEPLKKASNSNALQAALLLEYAWLHSKPNFQISLLLIRLYSFLGCGSLAMRAYQRLQVKQIQHDTLSHYMFDRISTLHPHPFSINDGSPYQLRGPVEHFQDQQTFYKSASRFVRQNRWKSFEHGNYNSIFEFKEVSEILVSMSAVTNVVERRKIARLTQPELLLTTLSRSYEILPPNPEDIEVEFADTNDYESLPNFECSQTRPFDEAFLFASGPSNHRSHLNLFHEKLITIVDPASHSDASRNSTRLWLKQYLLTISNKHERQRNWGKSTFDDTHLSKSERAAMQAYKIMAQIIHDACDRESWTEPNFPQKFDTMNSKLCELLGNEVARIVDIQDPVPAFQGVLHSLYSSYELGRTVLNMNKYLSHVLRNVPESQIRRDEKAAGVAERLLKIVVEKSTVIKKGLDEGGWIDKVLESVMQGGQDGGNAESIAETLKGFVDDDFMEEWAGEVVESWTDSVVGFSYFKVAKV